MSEAFIGEIRLFPWSFIPDGWLECDGRLLMISEYTALYSLIGTNYGGNGSSNFNLPDLRSRVPMGCGTGTGLANRQVGQTFGVENVALSGTETAHGHTLMAVAAVGGLSSPGGNYLSEAKGSDGAVELYSAPSGTMPTLAPASIGTTGGGLPHENRMPSLALRFGICISGDFPTRG
jgi:microcystin-dependent protein